MSTEDDLQVVSVERINGSEIIVEFSDSTCATFTTAQLVAMASDRRRMNGGTAAQGNGGG